MMSDRGFFSGAGLFFDEIPIVEIVDLWFHRKTGRYAVLALLGEDASEEMLWMNGRQFRCFRQQCFRQMRHRFHRSDSACLGHRSMGGCRSTA